MKHSILILLAFCLSGFYAYAQAPTITNSALPSVGDVFANVRDTNFVMTMTAGSSTAQTWSYSPSSDKTKNNSFVSPTTAPGSSNFPSSTMAMHNSLDSEVVYFVKNSSGLYIDGFYIYRTGEPTSNVPLDFSPNNQLSIPTPMTYGDIKKDTSKAVVLFNYGGNDLKFVTNVYKEFNADAFGSLTTPSGTYSNTLRVKETYINKDTVYIKIGPVYNYLSDQIDTSVTYHWLQNASPVILLDINMKKPFTLNQSESAEYNTIVSSQNDNALFEEKINAYPNPVQNVLHFNLRDNKNIQSIRIMDISGKILIDENIGGYDLATISMTHYPAGVYIYQLYDKNGNLHKADKFIKQ